MNLMDRFLVRATVAEARAVTARMRERAWPSRSVITKPFWTPGKRGLD